MNYLLSEICREIGIEFDGDDLQISQLEHSEDAKGGD